MRVFISWSGKLSQAVAIELREWLPSVIQAIEPYVSSEDIEKGARWGSEVSKELDASDFGILCITPTNTGAPWVNFEAGALSKAIDRSRVVPLLFRLDRADLPQGPLVQFQSVLAEREEIKKMVFSLNASCDDHALDDARLEGIFNHWWPRLDEALSSIDIEEDAAPEPQRSDQDLLAEVLEIVRGQQQILNTPEILLPAPYVEHVFSRVDKKGPDRISPRAVRDLANGWTHLIAALENAPTAVDMHHAVEDLAVPIEHILRQHRMTFPRYRNPIDEEPTAVPEDSREVADDA